MDYFNLYNLTKTDPKLLNLKVKKLLFVKRKYRVTKIMQIKMMCNQKLH